MDPVVCRDTLDKLIAEESSTLDQLHQLLDREHEFLVANDVDALERAGHARQNCIGTLMRIEDDRKALCRALNVPTDNHGLDRVLAVVRPPPNNCVVVGKSWASEPIAAVPPMIATARWSLRA